MRQKRIFYVEESMDDFSMELMSVTEIIRLNNQWLLMSIGCFRLFRKDGIKGIYAFIPGVREYMLAIMSEREEEGRTYFILTSTTG